MNRAIVFHGPERPLELISLNAPSLREGEALVRVTACNLCRSDLHSHAGRRSVATPTILGHEIVGRFEAFGPSFSNVDLAGQPAEIGDRITWSIIASCGKCFFCQNDLPQKCQRQFKYGHEAIDSNRNLGGGLADSVVLVPGTAWLRLPENIPDAVAALANCSAATAAAVLRYAGPIAGQRVLVIGAGVLGAIACAMASAAGASRVVVLDPQPSCRARAQRFGATDALDPNDNGVSESAKSATGDIGFDAVLELAGSTASTELGLSLVRTGGTMVLAGAVSTSAPLALDPESIVRRMITLRGVHNYHPRDLQTAVAFLAEYGHKFPFASLLTETFPLDQTEAAFRCAHAAPGVRATVVPT
jgi:alcohol dehydrogenase